MRHETQVDLVEQILAHRGARTTAEADAITTNPVTAYTCPSRLLKEQHLIRSEPLLMGLSCRLEGPGDCFTDDNTGIPILVLRDADGEVRAFVNTCRHRGARLIDDVSRIGKHIVCPYHAWTYNLDGTLAAVPHKESFAGFDFASCRLTELPALEQHGLIWVRPSGADPIDGDAHLSGLADEFASYGFEDYHHYKTHRIDCEMNWKIIIDTFLEPYHFAALHRNTVGPIFIPNLCLFNAFGRNLRETLPRKSIVELRNQPKEEWDLIRHTAIVYVLFPNTVFVVQIDHAEIWRVFPRNDCPDQSVVFLDFFIPDPIETESARRHWENNFELTIRTVEEEDFPTGEGAQRGYASGALDAVTYGRNEPALAFFERTLATAVGEAI